MYYNSCNFLFFINFLIINFTCLVQFANSYKRSAEQNLGRGNRNKVSEQIMTHYIQRRKNNPFPSPQENLISADPEELVATDSILNTNFLHQDLIKGDCTNNNCVDDNLIYTNKWSMPLLKSGDKRYYLGTFFKANWYRAAQYCRYHGMHLASISSQEENDKLEKHVTDFGLGHEHFWTSGTDLAEEGTFFWMANGRPIVFTNWNAGEPNNFRYENGEEEHCLELWNRDGKGLKWNDSPCSFETYFICEV